MAFVSDAWLHHNERYLSVFMLLPLVSLLREHGFSLAPWFTLHVAGMLLAAAALPVLLSALLAPEVNPERKRHNHAFWAYVTLLCIAVGMLSIVAHKAALGKPLLSFSLHASAGWLMMAAFVVQGVYGNRKLHAYLDSGMRVYRWHGLLGAALACAPYLVLALGLVRMLHQPGTLAVAMVGCMVPLLYNVLLFTRRIRAWRASASYAAVPTAADDERAASREAAQQA